VGRGKEALLRRKYVSMHYLAEVLFLFAGNTASCE